MHGSAHSQRLVSKRKSWAPREVQPEPFLCPPWLQQATVGVWRCLWLGIQTQLSWVVCWDIMGCAGCWSCHSIQRLGGTGSAFLVGRVICLEGIPDVLAPVVVYLVAQQGY